MKKTVFPAIALLLVICSSAQSSNIDVLNYAFQITVNDKNDTIYGTAFIRFVAKEKTSSVQFDLAGLNKEGKGMFVTSILASEDNSIQPSFVQEKDKLTITLEVNKGDATHVIIYYKGIPSDGLIISKNKFGKRTFFSDNWPNRAHQWLPCKDDPADKASVEFFVSAPSHYKVVSNGEFVLESPMPGDLKLTHWKEDVPLPAKVMVVGIADFAVDNTGEVNGVPVSTWVFADNAKEGFYDYAPAKDILSFFMNYIGPYPYKKLANVQSKTIFGGMENASAIFYYENSVTGKRKQESLLSHEIVHQWFGDMATEKSFPHLWLSEGFATYLTHIYIESKYGTDSLNNEMKKDRSEIIDFAGESRQPVVDSVSSYMKLLNANSYQKGGWVLHMLRRQSGDSVFHTIIRNYYAAYAGKNADTRDFQRICEKVSGKNLQTFFQQWLYTPALPKLNTEWVYYEKTKNITITVTQLQDSLFQFPLEIELQTASGKSQWETLSVTKKNQSFTIGVKEKITNIYLDPKTSLLFEGSVSPGKQHQE